MAVTWIFAPLMVLVFGWLSVGRHSPSEPESALAPARPADNGPAAVGDASAETAVDSGRRRRGLRGGLRIGAVVAIAAAAGVVAWVLLDRSNNDSSSSSPPTPTLRFKAREPSIISIAALKNLAAAGPLPIYWVGPRSGTRIELTATSTGSIFVRFRSTGSARAAALESS